MQRSLFLLLHVLAATALGCASTAALAGTMAERIAQQGRLVVGVDYVVPPFIGGSKVRTPEAIDIALAEQVAERVHAKLETVRASGVDHVKALRAGADVVLATVPDSNAPSAADIVVPTGYVAGPMAIMRSDTDVKTWEQLEGRTICVSEGSRYAGAVAAQYGAIEKTFKAPADSLLALRTGQCDAAVHDDTMLNELIKFPEWKKFSARLPAGVRTSLAFVVPADDTSAVALLRQTTKQWRASRYLVTLTQARARDIAFEVYLDQNVPDCH